LGFDISTFTLTQQFIEISMTTNPKPLHADPSTENRKPSYSHQARQTQKQNNNPSVQTKCRK